MSIMTPKDKAKELINIMYSTINFYTPAKQCALIAVDELIKETSFEVPNIRQTYWYYVKQEIEKL